MAPSPILTLWRDVSGWLRPARAIIADLGRLRTAVAERLGCAGHAPGASQAPAPHAPEALDHPWYRGGAARGRLRGRRLSRLPVLRACWRRRRILRQPGRAEVRRRLQSPQQRLPPAHHGT